MMAMGFASRIFGGLRPRTIRSKVAVLFAAFIGLIALFIFLWVPARLEEQAWAALRAKAQSVATIAAFSVRSAVVFDDAVAMKAAIEGALEIPDLSYLSVTDTAGKVRAFVAAEQIGAGDAHAMRDSPLSNDIYRVAMPVEFNGETIGSVHVGISLQQIRSAHRTAQRSGAVVSLLTFIIGMSVVAIVSVFVTAPLRRMVGTAERIAEGDLSHRVNIASKDEVGQLADAFNTMVMRLQTTQQELQHANRYLELRVEGRTKSLRESEERFRLLYDAAFEGIGIVENGVVLDCNERLAEMLGCERPDLIGAQVMSFVAPESRDLVRANIATGRGTPYEHLALKKDGTAFPVEVQAKSMTVGGRGVRVTALRDITERKRAEEAEQHRQKRFKEQQTALARLGASDAIHRSDVDTALREITEVAGRTLEVARTSVWLFNETHSKITCADLYEWSESRHSKGGDLLAADYPNYFAALESERVIAADDAHEDPGTREFSASYLTPQGITSMLDVPIRLGGRRVGVVCHEHVGPRREWSAEEQNFAGSIGDMVSLALQADEHRKAQETLRQAQKMEAVGQLTGGIAHDFNNILTTILSNTELVVTDLPEAYADLRTRVTEIQIAARRGADMIRKLMAFSRQEQLQFEILNIADLCHETGAMLRRILPETIDIRIAGAAQSCIYADRGAVQQVLVNLGTNARDAMPTGGVLRIRTEQVHLDSDCCVNQDQPDQGEYVCMSVTDSGVGMDEETRRKIFDPFFTTKPVGKGTGLGMAMIYGLVKDHGGFVDVSSEVGKGTTIRIYFPLARDVATASSEDESVELRGGCETILLAEDEESIRVALQCILERYGYRVLLAQDGLDALNLYRSHDAKIDLVITDVVMPKMSGPALHREISNGGEGPAFLFSSGYAARDVAAYHKLDPTVPLIQKPWSTRDFVSRIRDVLDQFDADRSSESSFSGDRPALDGRQQCEREGR